MARSAEEIKKDIESGNTALGIEFGSTRIKAVLTDGTTAPIAQGSYEWENRLENGIWTYSLVSILFIIMCDFYLIRTCKYHAASRWFACYHTFTRFLISRNK